MHEVGVFDLFLHLTPDYGSYIRFLCLQVMPFVTKVKESVTAQGAKAMNVTLDFDEKALYEEVC